MSTSRVKVLRKKTGFNWPKRVLENILQIFKVTHFALAAINPSSRRQESLSLFGVI